MSVCFKSMTQDKSLDRKRNRLSSNQRWSVDEQLLCREPGTRGGLWSTWSTLHGLVGETNNATEISAVIQGVSWKPVRWCTTCTASSFQPPS